MVISSRFSKNFAAVFVERLQEGRAEWRRRHHRQIPTIPQNP
jgi:hypothetical protein